MPTATSRVQHALLAIYIVCSLAYSVACAYAVYDRVFHPERHVRAPFQINPDTLKINQLFPEATAAGIADNDVIESLNGESYSGLSQMIGLMQSAHVGDTVRVGVRKPDGTLQTLPVHLRNGPNRQDNWAEAAAIVVINLGLQFFFLFVGYWVVAARPRDVNAWLILLLLSFPSVFLLAPTAQTGIWLAFLGAWFLTLQVIVPLALLFFGIYFPERWRVDRKLPYLKWIFATISALSLGVVIYSAGAQYFHPGRLRWAVPASAWVDRILNPMNLLCVILFWVAIFDKLRTASTADARRRLRVLGVGSLISLGSLLLIFVLLPRLGIAPRFEQHPWIAVIGVLLSLLFPLTLAYVVVVQRAMDVRILLRIGTKYALARASLVIFQFAVIGFLVVRFLVPALERKQQQVTDIVILAGILLAIVRLLFARDKLSISRRLQQWLDRRFFREAYNAEVVLSELSEEARKFTEAAPLIETVAHRVSEVLHVPQIAVFLKGAGAFQLQQAIGLDLHGPLILPERSQTIQHVFRHGPARLYRERPDDWFVAADDDEKRTLDATHAELLLPLPGRERLMGLMALGPKLSEEAYSPADLRLLQSVAAQTGLALEISELAHSLADEAAQRERMHREMEIAREVQQRLFPQEIPVLAGASLAGACRPAEGVGGDYYDLIQLEDGRIGLAIGDVSGKGISAALLMASLRASLRGMTLEGPSDLARLMQKVNRLVFEASASNRYATFFFATFNPTTSELKYVNAGHNPPVVLRNKIEQLHLEATGTVVGLLVDAAYEVERTVKLQSGDVFLAYTDGISEAMTNDDEEWGEDRMIAATRSVLARPAQEILDHVFEAADKFTGGAQQHDDMTLLVLKLN